MSTAASLVSFAFQFNAAPVGNIRVRNADSLDNEFLYYSKLIEELAFLLTKKEDKEAVPPWVQKLSTAGYSVSRLRDKRNRYLLMLCLSLTVGSIEGPFLSKPPSGILDDVLTLKQVSNFLPAAWELDTTWEEEIANFRKMEAERLEFNEDDRENKKDMDGSNKDSKEKNTFRRCEYHGRYCPRDTPRDRNLGRMIDKQFRFLLNLCRPYIALLFRSSDKLRAAKWIQRLCIVDEERCLLAKSIRNDYMMLISGYLSNRCLIGPFREYPTDMLIPLAELAKMYRSDNHPFLDSDHPRTAQYFRDLPTPVEGAYALISCTGDLYETKFQ